MARERQPKPAAYHLLPIAEKRALAIDTQRERAVTCPDCDMQVMPVDLLAHLAERCEGRRAPGMSAKWVGWREAVAIIRRAIPQSEASAMMRLSRWARPNRRDITAVRSVGERGDRKYLLADLAKHLARRVTDGTNNAVSEEP